MLADNPVVATIPCVDLARARQFYGQTLGLPEMTLPIPSPTEEDQNAGAMFQCGQGTLLMVYVRSTPTKADHTAASWIVSDFDGAADGLLKRGVRFEVYPDMPDTSWDDRGVATDASGSKGAWFTDPEGNILSIWEMPA